MPFENYIDQLIEECIDSLCSDDINQGAESLQNLASEFAKSGMTMQSFLDTRTYIIESAKNKTDAIFINEKLKLSEKSLREKRTGSVIIKTSH
jgi:type IV secretory pathway VirB6-like protein